MGVMSDSEFCSSCWTMLHGDREHETGVCDVCARPPELQGRRRPGTKSGTYVCEQCGEQYEQPKMGRPRASARAARAGRLGGTGRRRRRSVGRSRRADPDTGMFKPIDVNYASSTPMLSAGLARQKPEQAAWKAGRAQPSARRQSACSTGDRPCTAAVRATCHADETAA
jgi:hypothetical protein